MTPKMVRVPEATDAEAALVRIRGAIPTDRYPGDPDNTPFADLELVRAALAAIADRTIS